MKHAVKRINDNPHIAEIICNPNRNFPNSIFPVLYYEEAFALPLSNAKSVKMVQALLYEHGWKNSWQNGIYDFHHYHSNTHESMVIVKGEASVILGGPGGKRVILQRGDLIIIPAGVGHRCTKASTDFICVGVYPSGKNCDIWYGLADELNKAIARIKKIPIPAQDPLTGKEGLLRSLWKKQVG